MLRILRSAGIGLAGVVALLLLWGLLEPRAYLDVEEHVVHVPDLPAGWQGAQIAAIADLQIGMWAANAGMIRRAVRHLVEERPAAVLLCGDFVYKPGEDPAEEIEDVVEMLRPLTRAGIATFAVLGNHDYGMNTRQEAKRARLAQQVRGALEAAGIVVLENEAFALRGRSGPTTGAALFIVGIGSDWAGEDDAGRAVADVPPEAPRIVFMHNPNSFPDIPARAAPLAVAAHTHGGQVRIPLTPEWSWLTFFRSDAVHADGWIDAGYGQPGNRLYVNRGLGFSTVPLRINAPPEITLFTLR